MASREKILLVGFSGSGKSSLLAYLKQNPPDGWSRFDDLDELVFQRLGKGHKDLAQLIEKVGWEQFRAWEEQELAEWDKHTEKGVLALGGGAFTREVWNHYVDSRAVGVCFLKTSFETCWKRLQSSSEIRPHALKGKEYLEKLYQERQQLFGNVSWVLNNDEGMTFEELKRKMFS